MFLLHSFSRRPPIIRMMYFQTTIALNKKLLLGMVARLYMLLGAGIGPSRISLEMHRRIVRVLRPAESAVRRLILALAKSSGLKAPPPRANAQSRSVPKGLARSGEDKERQAFALFDPRSRFWRERREKTVFPAQPHISALDDNGLRSPGAPANPDEKPADISPANLLRRIEAVFGALENLPHQAKRLVRVLARRQKFPHLKWQMPMQPGRPPGFRVKPRLEIDHVLRECDKLARNALALDTS